MKVRSQSLSIPTKHSRPRRTDRETRARWTVHRAGMARFGIRAKKVYGVSKPRLDELAKKIGKDHALGIRLWKTGIHDARLLGMLISEPQRVTSGQMEGWVRDFDNWDVCDGTCCHLFVDAKLAWTKAFAWSARKKEFEKRAGFALAAFLAVHDKAASDTPFREYLEVIEREAWDGRNFVRKAVNWALRNIGKRNQRLNREAIACAEKIQRSGTPQARWIAADALRELTSEAVQNRLRRKGA
jgi:3-methyladenine DNA glycosylase AlkD